MSLRRTFFLPVLFEITLCSCAILQQSAANAEISVDLTSDFSSVQGQSGLEYLSVGDTRPANLTNPGVGITQLSFNGETEMLNGSAIFRGPMYVGDGDIIPLIMKDTVRDLLLLHPEATPQGSLAAGVELVVPETGLVRVTGDFARANNFSNAGNGVDVGIYLNRELDIPLFEDSIASDHVVDVDAVFDGTGTTTFDFELDVNVGDRLLFAVFPDSQGFDSTFDITALRGTVATVPEPECSFQILALAMICLTSRFHGCLNR